MVCLSLGWFVKLELGKERLYIIYIYIYDIVGHSYSFGCIAQRCGIFLFFKYFYLFAYTRS